MSAIRIRALNLLFPLELRVYLLSTRDRGAKFTIDSFLLNSPTRSE